MNNINIYLKLTLQKLGDVKGESGADVHKDEILIESFHWGTETGPLSLQAGKGGNNRPRARDMTFTMKTNIAAPTLIKAAMIGDQVVQAIVSVRNANATNAKDMLTITLTDGYVTEYHISATIEHMIPLDMFSISFRTFEYKHRQQTAEGRPGTTVATSFDLATLDSSSATGTSRGR